MRDVDSVLDIEDTAGLSKPCDQDPNGASANRRLPDAWHASAEYRPQRHHCARRVGTKSSSLINKSWTGRSRSNGSGPTSSTTRPADRFLREAAITARLQHPGIVPIYGLGQDDDGPFYTMPFIQGQTLQEAIEGFQRDDPFRRDPGRRA